MSKVAEITVNVDELLALDKYEVDEESAHIELVDDPDDEEFLKLVRVCPAALYKVDGDGKRSFDYAGCLECGTCRIACEGTVVRKWENPRPTMGVEYRYGLPPWKTIRRTSASIGARRNAASTILNRLQGLKRMRGRTLHPRIPTPNVLFKS